MSKLKMICKENTALLQNNVITKNTKIQLSQNGQSTKGAHWTMNLHDLTFRPAQKCTDHANQEAIKTIDDGEGYKSELVEM